MGAKGKKERKSRIKKSQLLYVPLPDERQEVERLAGLGFTQEEMGLIMGISETTLRVKYRTELKVGGLRADAAVLGNLARMAAGDGPQAGTLAIYWAKVRRRWHEVQRVIHGYDPELMTTFVKQVVSILRRELPECCPACKTKLALPEKIAGQLVELSQKMAEKLPQSEIVQRPRPELAGDNLDDAPTPAPEAKP